MIYELRVYRCVPGRKPVLLSRFENETLRIWEKHGIRQAARRDSPGARNLMVASLLTGRTVS